MKRLWLIVAILMGCCEIEHTEQLELETLESAALVPGEWFGFRVTERKELVEKALQRWERAMCMRLEITADGPHSIVFKDRVASGGHIGGTWEAATLQVQTHNWVDSQVMVPLMHELAHLFAQTNEHVNDSVLAGEWQFDARNQKISAALLARICTVRDCGCFSPEG